MCRTNGEEKSHFGNEATGHDDVCPPKRSRFARSSAKISSTFTYLRCLNDYFEEKSLAHLTHTRQSRGRAIRVSSKIAQTTSRDAQTDIKVSYSTLSRDPRCREKSVKNTSKSVISLDEASRHSRRVGKSPLFFLVKSTYQQGGYTADEQ